MKYTKKFIKNEDITIEMVKQLMDDIVIEISRMNKRNLVDVNIICEEIYTELFNLLFGYNLICYSALNNGNHIAIDMYDENYKIAFQITSQQSNEYQKIKATIDKLKKLDFEVKEIKFILLRTNNNLKPKELSDGFIFNPEKHVYTNEEIVREINKKKCITEAYDILMQIIDSGRLNYRSVVSKTAMLTRKENFSSFVGSVFKDGRGDVKVDEKVKEKRMVKVIKETIHANGIDIGIYTEDFNNEFISLTDIARYKSDDPTAVIQNWMRNRDVIEFLGLWESLHNPDFKPLEFEGFKNQAGANAFTMSPKKWIENTGSIGIVSKSGRYGGTYAHTDIAFEFASWISPEFKLYVIQDYKRLKSEENSRLSLNWNLNRELSKINYRIHTDAIKENLLPPELTPAQISYTYASEADLLNVVLFGKTAKQWREENLGEKGNIRDQATLYQLLVLANMESYNAILIKQGKAQNERIKLLRELAIQQMQTLVKIEVGNFPQIEKKD